MDDVVIVEAPHDVHDGFTLADVGQELVAQAGALGGALDDAGDVDKLHGGGHDAWGAGQRGQRLQPGAYTRSDFSST